MAGDSVVVILKSLDVELLSMVAFVKAVSLFSIKTGELVTTIFSTVD